MFAFVRSLFSPEIILHTLVLEARAKRYSAPSGRIRVQLGHRRLDRMGMLSQPRIEGILDALLQIHGITDDYRPVITVREAVCEDNAERILIEVSIEVSTRAVV